MVCSRPGGDSLKKKKERLRSIPCATASFLEACLKIERFSAEGAKRVWYEHRISVLKQHIEDAREELRERGIECEVLESPVDDDD